MNIYIAAPWTEKTLARQVKVLCEAEGWFVTSRWIETHPEAINGMDLADDIMEREALQDLADINNSTIFLLLNTQARGHETSGKAVEMGVAIERELPIILVGPKTNIFHFLDNVTELPTIEAAIQHLRELTQEARK